MARKKYSASFKFNDVRETIEGERTDAEIAREHDILPLTLANWKKRFYAEGTAIFKGHDALEEIAHLERMLGKKEVELARIKSFLPN